MKVILFDGNARQDLLPFTFTRPVAEIRIGILNIREKWEHLLKRSCTWLSPSYLREKFPFAPGDPSLFLNASFLPDAFLAEAVASLRPGQLLSQGGELLAFCLEREDVLQLEAWDKGEEFPAPETLAGRFRLQELNWKDEAPQIRFPEDIFRLNGLALERDFLLLSEGRVSAQLGEGNRLAGDLLFLEEGVEIDSATINTRTGPVYIGKNALIMEGMLLRGPAAICEGAVVKMGARIYGPTTIGPGCVVGGEIKQSVIFGYSNKGHEGYLGNSVVGEWCNFGADTTCSNMKNSYGSVKLWSYRDWAMRDTGLSHCGLMMGDFSRTGVNTMLNTGTVAGVNVQVMGGGFPPSFIPDFTWMQEGNKDCYRPDKALESAARIKALKGQVFGEADARISQAVFAQTAAYRQAAGVKDFPG